MGRQNERKLNQLLGSWPNNAVVTQPWLDRQQIYRQLSNAYVKSGWIKKLGRGAYIRKGDLVRWTGGLYALQKQLDLSIHIGAQTALGMKGFAHYLALGEEQTVILFGTQNEKLPSWFTKAPWMVKFVYTSTNLFNDTKALGLTQSKDDTLAVTLSSPERAIMELIYLIPKYASYEEADLGMESLTTLRPKLVQSLLEDCNSIKVKRYFMLLAETYQHSWVKNLNLQKVDFGKGKRSLFKGGVFNSKYQITVPKL